jgi:hypothetical protein
MKKIIFLDFDGVLNTSTDLGRGSDTINDQLVANLNKVCAATGADCVISSDWRKFHSLDDLKKILTDHGFTGSIIDVTDDNRIWVDTVNADGNFDRDVVACIPRGAVIRQWATLNDCGNFVIVDDNLVGDDMDRHLVRTNMDTGLDSIAVSQMIDKLNV